MPKKSKRQTRKTPSMAPVVTSGAASSATSTPFAPSMTAGRTSDADFKPDYKETIKDLKRIAILAGSFFAILVILSFFLR